MMATCKQIVDALFDEKYSYSEICEIKSNKTHMCFSVIHRDTRVYSLWLNSLSDNKEARQISPNDLSLRSDHLTYPVCAFTMNSRYIVALARTTFYCFDLHNLSDPPRTFPIDATSGTYGDLHMNEETLIACKDTHGINQILSFSLQELLTSETLVVPVVHVSTDAFSIAALSVSPSFERIAFVLAGGMSFQDAQIQVVDRHTSQILLHLTQANTSLMNPQWVSEEEIRYIHEQNQFPQVVAVNVVSGTRNELTVHDDIEDEIGDMYRTANQHPAVVCGDFYAYCTSDSIFAHPLRSTFEKGTKQFCANFAETLTAVPDSSKLLFKDFGERSLRIRLIDLALECPSVETVHEVPLIGAEVPVVPGVLSHVGTGSGYLYRPPGATTPTPTIIFLHGAPDNRITNALDLSKQFYLAAGFAVYDLQYTGTYGTGFHNRRALYGNWGKKDAQDVLAAAHGLSEAGIAEPGQIFLVGFCNGGFVAVHALAQDTEHLIAGACVHSTFLSCEKLIQVTRRAEQQYMTKCVPAVKSHKPTLAESLIERNASICFFHGSKDTYVSSDDTLRLYQDLKLAGNFTKYFLLTGDGHYIRKSKNVTLMWNETVNFFEKLVKLQKNRPKVSVKIM